MWVSSRRARHVHARARRTDAQALKLRDTVRTLARALDPALDWDSANRKQVSVAVYTSRGSTQSLQSGASGRTRRADSYYIDEVPW